MPRRTRRRHRRRRRRRRRRREVKSEPCQYASCDRAAEVLIEVRGKRYHVCTRHYLEIVKKIQSLASRRGEASTEDLKIYTREGKITRVIPVEA